MFKLTVKKLTLIDLLVVIYFITILLFGKSFTKLQVVGPLYLHDLCLALLVFLCLAFRSKIKIPSYSILLMIIIAGIYFVIDLIRFSNDGTYFLLAIRQFSLFLYLLCCLLIFSSQVRNMAEAIKAVSLIRMIGWWAVIVQCVYLIYGFFLVPGFSVFEKNDYNYFTPLVVMGIITFSADAITDNKSVLMKIVKFTAAITLSLTLGHSSAFLAVFVILMFYAYVKIRPIQRLFSFAFILLAVLMLLFLPQFTDTNASWRLLFWKHILVRSVTDGYLIFGHGFGKAYMTYDYALYMYKVLDSKIMLDEYYPMARHLNPPHNSILTLVFHIGLVPALLFFAPLRLLFKQLFLKKEPGDGNVMFLILSVCGCLVWISFNVILELPHTATYFWLVFFTTVFYLKNRQADKVV